MNLSVQNIKKGLLASLLLPFASTASAAGGLPNWYSTLAQAVVPEVEKEVVQGQWWAGLYTQSWSILASLAILLLIVVLGLASGFHKLNPEKMSDEEILPPSRFSLVGFFELGWAIAVSALEGIIGPKWKNFAPILGSMFFFILLSNLSGLVPGFSPATTSINMGLAMAFWSFILFNYVGFKYAGTGYLKHMCGPLLALAPLLFLIETLSLLARPVSLSLRLAGNINGDHLVFDKFLDLFADFGISFIPFPAALLGFGTLVSVLQAFIFLALSCVYVKLSLDTAHH